MALVVAAGWLLRAWPAIVNGGWWRTPVDYDDSVYFAASALLARGVMPYRDFVLVHPPGLMLLLAPVAKLWGAFGMARAFSVARGLMTLIGAANIALSARVAWRAAGPVAAVAAAVAYAILPEAAGHERSTYLEPALNLACLLLADRWLATCASARPRRGALVAGLFLGFAVSVKAWGLLWAIACVAAWPSERARSARSSGAQALRSLSWLAAGAGVVVLATAAPFLIAAPRAFVEQTLEFQLWRPADGIGSTVERAAALLGSSWPLALLGVVGWVAAARSRKPRAASPSLDATSSASDDARWRSARFFGAAWVAILAAFLASRTYWPDYNAHLAPALAPLAGLGAAFLWGAATKRGGAARVAVVVVLAAAAIVPLSQAWREAAVGGDLFERVGERVRSIPEDACYFPFEPAWALAGDRLPWSGPGHPPVVDVYATLLLAGRGLGREGRYAQDELRSRAAQNRLRELIVDCDYLSLGERGALELTPHTRRWIASRWEELAAPGEADVDFWRLRR